MIKFPENFLWGAATAAYQVEGNNIHSDWWPWEEKAGKERSGAACAHYELYEQDFDLAKSLHHNAHRFSIEWARIEPEEGKFSQDELNHYLQVLLALRARGIEPIVTLHHFTNPVWLSEPGGWENKKSAAYFTRYCDFVVRGLARHVRYWITINEPTIYVSHAFLFGVWPPQSKSFLRMRRAEKNMLAAHIQAYRLIHKIYKALQIPKPFVSISQHMMALVPCSLDWKNRFAAFLRQKLFNESYLDTFARHKTLDFIGVNYYSRQLVDLKKWGLRNLVADVCESNHHPAPQNALGWAIYPEGLYQVLVKLKKYHLPVMITENGICTSDDAQRWQFIQDHLRNIHRAIDEGIPVTGYLYWSLLDNFEWDKGFGPRFGLIDIDYQTQKRTVRDSAKKFGRICETHTLE